MIKIKALKKALLAVCAILILGLLFLVFRRQGKTEINSMLDNFAQCLAEKKITMYGAAWCSHCDNEKKAFGASFRFVPYVECPDNPKKCLDLGITGYPTWIFPDGRRFKGEQGIEKLAEESECVLPGVGYPQLD